MKLKISLFLLSFFTFLVFTFLSYTVAKEMWQQIDFDTTVKLQDHISRQFDREFSYFSYIGSAEVTIAIALIFTLFYLVRLKILAALAWLLIIPASLFEIFGKLVIFHPAPPVLFHRNILETKLPSFYVHTNFSYPSGHMTRTIFLLTTLFILVLFSRLNIFIKLLVLSVIIIIGFMMMLTRVYLGEHWLSDVLGGTLLGISAGLFAASLILKKRKHA